MEYIAVFVVLLTAFVKIYGIYHEHDCPENEVYDPCYHMEEIPCWTGSDRKHRIYQNPKNLFKCKPVCNCRDTWVREWTGGKCIKGNKCRANPPADWFKSQDDGDNSTESTSESYDDKQ